MCIRTVTYMRIKPFLFTSITTVCCCHLGSDKIKGGGNIHSFHVSSIYSVPWLSLVYHVCGVKITQHGMTPHNWDFFFDAKPLETESPYVKFPEEEGRPTSLIWGRASLIRGCLFLDALICIAWWKWGVSRALLSLSPPQGHSSRDQLSLYWLSAQGIHV